MCISKTCVWCQFNISILYERFINTEMIQNFKIVFSIMNKKGDGDSFHVKVKSLSYKQVMENNQIGISYLIVSVTYK